MHPVLIKFGPIVLYSYGAMVALGFALAIFLMYRNACRFGLDRDQLIDLAIVMLVFGIVGARMLYVALNFSYYMAHPLDILKLSKGGLVWYGGFIAALAAAIVYARRKKINFWLGADLMAPYIALAQSLGRIGCFLNGCCYGLEMPAGSFFGVTFPMETCLRMPTQLYSSAALLLIFIALRIWQERRHFVGEIFLGYCMLYSLKRFFIEFFRGDNPRLVHGLTVSQAISIAVFMASLGFLLYKVLLWRKKDSVSK